jgi:hypothetical protein
VGRALLQVHCQWLIIQDLGELFSSIGDITTKVDKYTVG